MWHVAVKINQQPGGHLELQESWDACARREVLEETGLAIAEPTSHIATTNDPMPAEGNRLRFSCLDLSSPNLERMMGWG